MNFEKWFVLAYMIVELLTHFGMGMFLTMHKQRGIKFTAMMFILTLVSLVFLIIIFRK